MLSIRRKRTTSLGVLALLAMTGGIVAGSFTPAQAALTNTSLVMSNNQVGAASTYTAVFSTGTALVTDLLLGLPSTVGGLATATESVFTAPSCTGTFSAASLTGSAVIGGNNIALPVSVPTLGTCVKVVVSGLTNPASVGTAYACEGDALAALLGSNLTVGNLSGLTCASNGLTGGVLGSALSDVAGIALSYVAQATNGITTALDVAPALTTTIAGTYQAFNITPTSTGAEATNPSQALTVATNAQNYTVEGLVSGTTSSLTWVGPSAHSILFGYTAASGGGAPANCTGSGTAFGANGTYASVQNALTGLTNGQVTNVNYCWNVDYTDPAGQYDATVTYLVVPTF